jgi:DNA polymerase-3 subunit delta'
MFTHVFGHKKQIELLQKSIESGKLAHAYIFSGPNFVGKKFVAKKFASKLLEIDEQKENTFHPDLIEVGTEEAIKIEEVRELIYKLSLKPYQAKYKIALINNAENMTVEAQNSLLKVLEEPKSYTVIILVTSNPGKLLRTIASRAQKINFGPVQASEFESLLGANISAENRELVLKFAAGRPGLASEISRNPDFVEKLIRVKEDYGIFASQDLAEKLRLAYDLADLETADLKQVLEFWLIIMEQELQKNPNAKIAQNLSEINKSRKFLDQNVNSKLLLTNLMLNLS